MLPARFRLIIAVSVLACTHSVNVASAQRANRMIVDVRSQPYDGTRFFAFIHGGTFSVGELGRTATQASKDIVQLGSCKAYYKGVQKEKMNIMSDASLAGKPLVLGFVTASGRVGWVAYQVLGNSSSTRRTQWRTSTGHFGDRRGDCWQVVQFRGWAEKNVNFQFAHNAAGNFRVVQYQIQYNYGDGKSQNDRAIDVSAFLR